jgi:PAS domain S-box-containing protein
MTRPRKALGQGAEVDRLYHELQVHQEELVLQNEELRRFQTEVEAALKRYTDLYEFAPIAYLTVDDRERIVDVNLTASTMLGVPRGQLRQRPLRRFVATADLVRFEQFLAAVRRGDPTPTVEAGIVAGDGTALACHLSGGRDPHTSSILVAMLDRTEQRRTEETLRQTGVRLADSQRLEAIGRLAGGVAHDFNNILTAINGTAELVAEAMAPDDPLRPDIEVILESGRHAAALTRQLLAFGRRLPLQPVTVSLQDAIGRIAPLLRRTLGEDIVLTLDLTADLPPVVVDPVQLEQVVVNLVFNARDAMPDGGPVLVRLSRVEPTPDLVTVHPELQSRTFARLDVTDAGGGVHPDALPRLFEPFYTTKEMGHGTGLGLATVEGIVAQSGGWIEVESEFGRGSTFSVILPCAESSPSSAAATKEAPRTGTETILLVEDEASVRSVVSRMLRDLGYTVVAVADPEAALALDAATFAAVDLLLTDVVMPHMSGERLADSLMERRPRLPVLYVSGFSPDAVLHARVKRPNESFLAKPFTRAQLAAAARAALERARSAD